VLLTLGTAQLSAQTPNLQMPLSANQYKINRLAPGVLNDQAVFYVDQSNTVRVEITASSNTVNTSILTPGGQVINPNTIGAFGGSFETFDTSGPQTGSVLLPTLTTGFHFVYMFQNQGSGEYTVRFQAATAPSGEIALFTEVSTDSKIGVSFLINEPVITLGNPVVLSAAVFNDQTLVSSATVSVVVRPPAGSSVNLSLLDDGGPADGGAGDGLYSGEFTPATAGKYTALARITGTVNGAAFSRQAVTSFSVVAQSATLTGSISDHGVDDNGNSLFDRIVVTAGVDAKQAGKHRLFARLKTPSGKTIVRSSQQDLVTGVQSFDVSLEADAFTVLGENGPYTIDSLELEFIGSNGSVPSDRLFNLGGTKPYQLSQLEQAALSFVGVSSTQGEDTNGNSLFDKLVVMVQVRALVAGSYSWSLKLLDQSRAEIDFASGTSSLASGLNTIRVEFRGSAIGSSGIDGPYLLRDLLLFSSSLSIVQSDVGLTNAFKASQFEAFNSNISNLSITQTASPNPVAQGANLTYVLTVTNNGPRSAPSVTVSDNLPASTTFVSCSSTGGGICGGLGNARTVTFVPLGAGESATITIIAVVGVANTITNTATVTSTSSDPSLSNNTATATVQISKTVQLSSTTYTVNESQPSVEISITRSGDASAATSVNFATSDTSSLNSPCSQPTGKASERCDYATSLGTLRWTAGEVGPKTLNIPIVNDVLVEGSEVFNLTLSNPTGATLGSASSATVTIVDNDTAPSGSNPIDGVEFFILQQYRDILNRQPDQAGFQNWINTLAPCPNGGFGEPPTSNCDRLHVAAGFFQSDEFLNRGYFAFRFYMVSYGVRPTYAQFIPDMAQVGGPKSPADEEASKVAYANAFVQRPEFTAKYGSASGQALANALLQTAGLPSGSYNAGSQTNGQILRGIAESSTAFNKFLNEGTVSIMYFGFQRRDPDAVGYQNNLNTLNANPNNLRHMIFIFIYSTEYRSRFGP
jgi:uncharacterized repeat protein (TIGR01451 family)